jgi:hypothetical protein
MSYQDAWGLKYEEVMSLAWLAYRGQGTVGNWNFPNAGSRWSVSNVYEFASYRAVLVQGSKKVLSLAGTDDVLDWYDNVSQGLTGVSPQYIASLALARNIAPDIVVGHSLGGGMASYCALYGGKHAATINPAPLNINPASAIGWLRNRNLVVNYVVPGEILDRLDTFALNMAKVGRIVNVTSTATSSLDRHSIANLTGFVAPQRI